MVTDTYSIFAIDEVDKEYVEQMGSKRKFWFTDQESQKRWLFKYAREGTGEDWAEKIACEIAALLGLPHATVELATCQSRRGTKSLDFTENARKGDLVHGNELLVEIDDAYPRGQRYHASQHRVDNIVRAISQDFIMSSVISFFPDQECRPVGLFLGYLLLDALIGNTDRHHENWGLLVKSEGGKRIAELAPTFDHASSLGRDLDDAKVSARIVGSRTGKGPSIEKYAEAAKARSAIYLHADDTKALAPLDAFKAFRPHAPDAARIWLDKLRQISEDTMKGTVEKVPASILSPERKEFVCSFLRYNRRRLLETGASS